MPAGEGLGGVGREGAPPAGTAARPRAPESDGEPASQANRRANEAEPSAADRRRGARAAQAGELTSARTGARAPGKEGSGAALAATRNWGRASQRRNAPPSEPPLAAGGG
jgi:hypothetical protein